MIITYYGASCFKVQSGETVLAFNPPSKESEYKSPRFQSDIIFVSLDHKDFNGWENMAGKEDKEPFIINGPGEYEVSGIEITALPVGLNTIYTLSLEDISLCHLGAFDEKEEAGREIKEKIGEVDVLFIPISPTDGQKAAKIAGQIEPKVVIPMHYKEANLKQFLKEFGNGDIQKLDKLTIKKKELIDKKNQAIVLEPCLS